VSDETRQYVENNAWQIEEINAAAREADAGDFASEKDVRDLAGKGTRRPPERW
jgi:predicted transcriptional regulator